MDKTTCIKCGSQGLTWAQTTKGNWYLGYPVEHTFEDGNTIITHIAAHICASTPEGLAAMEARIAERQAERDAEQAKLDAIKAEQAKLHHVEAEIGEQVTLTGIVTMATSFDTAYGRQMVVVVKTDDHQVAKMFTTASWAWGVDFDDVITIAGTVKEHGEYQGIPQTTLTRPKLVA